MRRADAMARRERRRDAEMMGMDDFLSSDDDDIAIDAPSSSSSPSSPPLTWSTYHVGFLCNIWTFLRAQLPPQHALPRAIRIKGQWKQVIMEHSCCRLDHARQIQINPSADGASISERMHASASAAPLDPNAVVRLQYEGQPLPTSVDEVEDFRRQLSTQPTYTKPATILGRSKVKPADNEPRPLSPTLHAQDMQMSEDDRIASMRL